MLVCTLSGEKYYIILSIVVIFLYKILLKTNKSFPPPIFKYSKDVLCIMNNSYVKSCYKS